MYDCLVAPGAEPGCGLLLQSEWRCLSVLVTIVSPAKVAEWIEMPFGGADSCDCRYSVLDGGAHWCYIAKITDPSVWRRRCVRSLPLL